MFRRDQHEERSEDEPVPGPTEAPVGAPKADVTVVGKGARLEGTVSISGSLQIEGHIKGEIKADDDVELLPHGRVEGDIEGQTVRVAGTVMGHVVAKGRPWWLAEAGWRGTSLPTST